MSLLTRAAVALLRDIGRFSKLVIGLELRAYQLQPLRAVIESVLQRRGDEVLMVFPRQSGKNEAAAQLETYLLNLFQRVGGNIVHGATGDALGMATDRLEERLNNPWNASRWGKRTKPVRRTLGKAAVAFLSTHPQASARGQTAHWLLIIDEAQDQVGPHIEAVFTPMRAAKNATALYMGTVKLRSDYLWQKKLQLEELQAADGRQRVFLTTPADVEAELPTYGDFVAQQVARYGRHHPIVASEYFLEPVDGVGGLFDPRRRALMLGSHNRILSPQPGELYLITIDLAGADEAATEPGARLAHPARDFTVGTAFRVQPPPAGAPGPTYEAVDVFVDHGSKHFEDVPGRPSLAARLLAWIRHWTAAHVIADETGVGQGMVSWLGAQLGPAAVTGYNFSTAGTKAALGSAFIALIETGRFSYWATDAEQPLSDCWWFLLEAERCGYFVPEEGSFDRDLRWGVPPGTRVDTPTGPMPVHDDRLLSAAMVAHADVLIRQGTLKLGTARSVVLPSYDPLDHLPRW